MIYDQLGIRELRVLRAVLNYAEANSDDLNAAFESGEEDGKIRVDYELIEPITNEEIHKLLVKLIGR